MSPFEYRPCDWSALAVFSTHSLSFPLSRSPTHAHYTHHTPTHPLTAPFPSPPGNEATTFRLRHATCGASSASTAATRARAAPLFLDDAWCFVPPPPNHVGQIRPRKRDPARANRHPDPHTFSARWPPPLRSHPFPKHTHTHTSLEPDRDSKFQPLSCMQQHNRKLTFERIRQQRKKEEEKKVSAVSNVNGAGPGA